ncbi:hypothetical protein ACA910_018427 [Epithemia clementina (nom. ined.)]
MSADLQGLLLGCFVEGLLQVCKVLFPSLQLTRSNTILLMSDKEPSAAEHPSYEDTPLFNQAQQSPSNRLILLIVPETNPLAWAIINFILFVWSGVLLCQICISGEEGALRRPHGQKLYIAWSLASTAFWCIPTGLTVWYRQEASTWAERIELLLALYFFIDSVQLLQMWTSPDKDIKAQLPDVIISTICFLVVFVAMARQSCAPKIQHQQSDIEQDIKAGGDSSNIDQSILVGQEESMDAKVNQLPGEEDENSSSNVPAAATSVEST